MKRGIIILCLALASCTMLTPKVTATETPMPTATATMTPSITPTIIALDKPTPFLKGIVGQPVSTYKGWKIMPGAITGEEIGDSYLFTINTDLIRIYSFYKINIPEGWVNRIDMPSLLMFKKGNDLITITFEEIKENIEYCFVIIQFKSG
jgi:hypothetical protein